MATSLLFLSNTSGLKDGNLQYRYVSREHEILSNKGVLGTINIQMSNARVDHVTKEVQTHLLGLKEDVETQEAPYRVV